MHRLPRALAAVEEDRGAMRVMARVSSLSGLSRPPSVTGSPGPGGVAAMASNRAINGDRHHGRAPGRLIQTPTGRGCEGASRRRRVWLRRTVLLRRTGGLGAPRSSGSAISACRAGQIRQAGEIEGRQAAVVRSSARSRARPGCGRRRTGPRWRALWSWQVVISTGWTIGAPMRKRMRTALRRLVVVWRA